ncbi:sugar ABC transporter permease [Streptomyces sp. PSKA54]|uniref:Sugar ABC transporter permease n=1 Tax=Streptomyces himalayensis subsp. aureolus TaxID=2758039 RepID=A0A7W2CX98_9ACTN|nr:sugar ABC transporter permease [Streptomyces himalayensis]MBA4860606.1 sugar ABC transporter permease [Streptomyces himalayensis subsp. aureolus]
MRHGKYPFVIGFLIPPVVLYLVFVIGPYLQAFYISMTDWRGLSPEVRLIGLDNFARVFQDEMFWKALRNHGQLLLTVPLLTIAIALLFAFLLNVAGGSAGNAIRGLRGSTMYKIVFFFPQVLSIAVLGVLFQLVYRPDEGGLLNGLLGKAGIAPVGFLTDPDLALWSIIAVMVWSHVGFYLVLFSAGMAAIPKELYEAAAIDGAGRARTFFSVTLPLLRNHVQTGWIYLGIGVLDYFVLIKVLSVDEGGPDGATTVLGMQVWKSAFTNYNFGYASALGVVLFFIVMTFAMVTMRFTSNREETEF